MRTAALFAIAVLFASAVRAAAPSPEDWYTPETYEDIENSTTIYYGYKDGKWEKSIATIDMNGNITLPSDVKEKIGKNYNLKTALQAIQMSLKNTKQIQTLGQNLNDLLILGGIRIADNEGGGSYTVRFGDGTKSIKDVIAAKDDKGNVPATSDRKLADGFTLDWRVDNVNGTEVRSLQLKGARDAVSVDNYKSQWFRLGGDAHYLPFLRWGSNPGAGELIWTNFGGFDNTAFGEVPTADQGTHGVPLTLKGWYTNGFEHTTVTRLMTEDDDDAKDLRKKLQILARKTISDQSSAPDHLTYIPIGDVISGLGLPPDDVSIESYVAEGSTNLAIKGWHDGTAKEGVVLADLLTEKKSDSKERPAKEYTVLVREHDNAIGSNTVAYASLGNLYGVTWATNWTEAVEHITKEETVKIVNWVTNSETIVTHVTNTVNWVTNEVISVTNTMNWVTNEVTWVTNSMTIVTNELVVITNTMNWVTNEMVVITNNINLITNEMVVVTNTLNLVTNEMVYVTNTVNIISNQLNWVTNEVSVLTNEYVVITNVTEKFSTIENWMVITNYFVNYLGGGNSGGGGGGSGGGTPPEIRPEHDPYSPEYQHDPLDEVTLPVKNALLIKAMTNDLFAAVNATNVLDCESLYTNDLRRAEINGYWKAATNQIPVKVRIENDDENRIGDHEYGIEWMDYPTDLMGITSTDIKKIVKWLRERTSETNILSVVATNYETLAGMATNLFGHVRAEALLDNYSVWTNGARQIEIKGYHSTAPFTVPYIDWGETTNYYNTSHWEDQGHYEEQIDPETGATNQVWISNMVWVYEWSGMATEGKVMKWERYPFADYELSSRYAEGAPLFWSINQGELEKTETGMSEPQIFKYMSIYGFATSDDCAIPWRHEVTSEEDDPATVSNCQAKINWTTKPEDASPTKNYELTMNGTRVAWTPSASAIRFVGNVDPAGTGALAEAVVGEGANTNTVTFASASDSNVKVDVQSDGNGNVTITIGVYYVTESNNPSSGSSGL